MAKNYKVRYELIYEGGSKSTYATIINMDGGTSSEAVSKIRATKNINTNVRDIVILEIVEN